MEAWLEEGEASGKETGPSPSPPPDGGLTSEVVLPRPPQWSGCMMYLRT